MTEHARRPHPPRERQRLRDETADALDGTAAGPVTAEASSAARAALDLDRHWRNACVDVLHGPARWKSQAAGRYHMTGERSPRHSAI